jgi:hypothetical protein
VKRESTSTLDKPVLDEETFQQLLAAANILQQHNDGLRVKEPKADYAQTLSDGAIAENVRPIHVVPLTPETVAHPVAPREPQPKPAHLARLAYRYRTVGKRSSLTDELFWKAATVVAVAAVSALLLGATINRLSPLPGRLALPSEVVQQQVPFRRTKRIVTAPAQSGAVGTKTVVMEPPMTPKTGSRRTAVADQPPGSRATPASPQKTTVNPTRPYSTYGSEADIVAEDTVVRYGTRSAAPRLQARKKL